MGESKYDPMLMRSDLYSIYSEYHAKIRAAEDKYFSAGNQLGYKLPKNTEEVLAVKRIAERAHKDLLQDLSMVGVSYEDFKKLSEKFRP